MITNINLNELERNAFKSFFKDGLWDLSLGFSVLGLGADRMSRDLSISAAWTLGGEPILMYVFFITAILILILGKKLITVPRLGHVRFGPKRKARVRTIAFILAGAMILGLLVFVLSGTDVMSPRRVGQVRVGLVLFAMGLIIILCLTAWFLDFTRLYAYAFLLGPAHPVAFLLKQNTSMTAPYVITYLSIAGVMFIIGLVLFIRFLRDYSVPVEGVTAGGGGQ